jgi:hypothetical protein
MKSTARFPIPDCIGMKGKASIASRKSFTAFLTLPSGVRDQRRFFFGAGRSASGLVSSNQSTTSVNGAEGAFGRVAQAAGGSLGFQVGPQGIN